MRRCTDTDGDKPKTTGTGRLFRISNYEWELLEDLGHLAGRSIQGWYEIFLATNDAAYLERLLTFWHPPDSDLRFLAEYSRADFQAGADPTAYRHAPATRDRPRS